MIEQVERRKYHSKVPAWIRKLMKKEEENSRTWTVIDVAKEAVVVAAAVVAVEETEAIGIHNVSS